MSTQSITVADGNFLVCQHKCPFQWIMNKKDDFLGSCDMVLEVQWLSTLGAIIWDFKELMKFEFDNHSKSLKGEPPHKIKVIEGVPSSKLVGSAPEFCVSHKNY